MTDFAPADVPFFVLVLARVGGTMALAPVLGSRLLPAGLRAAVALVLAAVLAPAVPRPAHVASGPALLAAVTSEAAVGLAFGFAAWLLFAAVETGGALLDQELGLSMARVLDPSGDEPVALVAQLKLALATAAYLVIDGHHLLLSGLAESFRLVPLGQIATASGAEHPVAALGTGLFVFAVKIAAPALTAVFAVTLATALVVRAVPEAGVFVAALPIRLVVGLVVVAAALAAFVSEFAASVRGGGDAARLMLEWIGGRR